LPQDGDRGLDQTPTWGRTYWGGAMFCLLADIEIRKLTDNRKSLRDALRGVLDDGYSMHASAAPMQIFAAADRATGVDVLVPLYLQMKSDPFPVDLEQLWRDLGVAFEGDTIVYDDDAPLAYIRKALLKS
jgi:predicted metalloprotease with PDZ domain